MAVCDGIAEDKAVSGIVDTGRGVSVISRKADGDVSRVIESVAHDIDIADIGRDRDGFRPAGLAVFDIVAEEKDIGDGVAASPHEKDGIGAVILAFWTGS